MARNFAKYYQLVPASVVLLAVVGVISPQATAVADDTCASGYVWRNARSGDVVCVTPAVRDQTAQENALAAQRVDPNGGPYGPDTCKQGFVWREAYGGDHVCVTPASRTQAANDNGAAASRKASAAPPPCLGPNPAPGLIPPGMGGFCN